MGEDSTIQWTDHTWNPWQGCAKVSPGCDNCYMFRDKARYGQNPLVVVRSKPPTFNRPRRWNAVARERGVPARVFTASWADFFSREADAWRPEAWALIRECTSLTFQILTKRHGRIATCLPDDWGDGYYNVWLGVSGENQEWADRRWDALSAVPARVRFVSYEPAIGPLSMRRWATVPDWLIVGGESGSGARPFDVEWARTAIAECRAVGVACFVKQLGANVRTRNDDCFTIDEDPWDESFPPWPTDLVADDRIEHNPNGFREEYQGAPVRVLLRDSHGGDVSEWRADLRVREFPGGNDGE